jgi:hypothetical protein
MATTLCESGESISNVLVARLVLGSGEESYRVDGGPAFLLRASMKELQE